MEDEYVLVHHGIKGMKWGIRKKLATRDKEQPYKKSTMYTTSDGDKIKVYGTNRSKKKKTKSVKRNYGVEAQDRVNKVLSKFSKKQIADLDKYAGASRNMFDDPELYEMVVDEYIKSK